MPRRPLSPAIAANRARARHVKAVLGPRIRLHRERLALTQAELAERLGTRDNQIRRWEAGEQVPRPATRRKLAEIFGIEIAELSPHPAGNAT